MNTGLEGQEGGRRDGKALGTARWVLSLRKEIARVWEASLK